MSLSTRLSSADLTEVNGRLRDCTPTGKGRRKLRAGDIAVIDAPDISRREAEFLIDHEPSAVLNIAQFSSGNVPNYGPLMLIDADIPLFEAAGPELREGFRDGAKKGAIDSDGTVHNGNRTIAQATPLGREDIEKNFESSQKALAGRMDSYFGDAARLLHSEGPLMIDGVGIPDVGDELAGRKVVVLSDGPDHAQELRDLRNFIQEYDPVLIGVGAAADTLVDTGYSPAFIVGDPAEVRDSTLRGGARVILPADPEGAAVGIDRIQELGVGATTFPTALGSPTELALLLAGHHDAQLVVIAGAPFNLDDVFANNDGATPETLLTRVKLGGRLVDATAIRDLYTVSGGAGMAWLWALLGILVAVAAVILIVGLGGEGSFADNLIDTWNSFALSVQSLFT
ncbi:thiamine pyrophosphokinase [Corynebacterium yudongzhengii]|uniref:Thiamine pyrophosphokinase n=1 Tax=Corynebacterium yudongzhengii TaxID=2080740 RepID=A0A2U1T8L6_9CORY|nr:putative cytokinetic ring protein SteA [Corynebacterium yudongzhengii]AWB81953.1 thiamine pyrophosphokinase [Corynebacterium yudongzhengii]PWC02346.1 thiamine pyrophosphokinase [Corynebacterium yudongzhengii]